MITYAGSRLIANYFCGKSTGGSSLYLGLSSTQPTVAGANVTEPSATTYARVQIAAPGSSSVNVFGTPTDGLNGTVSIKNTKTVYFPETWNSATDVGEDWGECKYVCIFSSLTNGNLLAYQELDAPIHPGKDQSSTIPIVRIGDIELSFGNPELATE